MLMRKKTTSYPTPPPPQKKKEKKKKEKRKAYSSFFVFQFSELDQIFSYFIFTVLQPNYCHLVTPDVFLPKCYCNQSDPKRPS